MPKINKPRFVIGEERNKRLLGPLLIGASKLAMTSIIKVLGEPGTAKDTLLRMWLELLPIKSVERSYMTAASLRYSPDMQNADLLFIPDSARGMWTLTTNPSPELTREVKKEKLKLRAGERPLISGDDLNLWQAVFKVLVEEEQQEIPLVPYAKQLFDLLESERSESRRDPDKLCDLISLVAWMRRFQKTLRNAWKLT